MFSLVLALLLAGAEPSRPPEAAAPAAQAAPAPAAAPEKKPAKKASDEVCWNETPVGTRFSKRMCASREEIEGRQRNDQEMISRWQTRGMINK